MRAKRTASSPRFDSDGAGSYVIQVWGKLESHWEPELRMQLSYSETERGVVSTLSGRLPDQPALLGALNWLAMWGYQILLVRYDVAECKQHAAE